ncbi:FAD-dependent oxidoreductase [Paraglaciecola arctica]|nr:FAD-dependent oxidoreductase [Paraglaciecola arctica]
MKLIKPFWFEQALANIPMPQMSKLDKKITADICIIGGGYTGLWTAIKAKQQAPNKRIVIIEKGLCGQGASGRNGGCMLTFSTKFQSLIRFYGLAEAIRLVKVSEQTVFDIEKFCQMNQIDAEVRTDGAIYTATNSQQITSLCQPLKLLSQHKLNQWQRLSPADTARFTGSDHNLAGIENKAGGSLHPGKLVLGLVKFALSIGVKIYQQTEYKDIAFGQRPTVKTCAGQVNATKVIFAINAWMGKHFNRFNRHITLVSSDMIITKPMPEQLAEIGLSHGKSIADSRIFVHYYRTTSDGRLMLGKGGNMFAYNNKMLPAFDQPSRFEPMLTKAFGQFFPRLKPSFETTWTGASDRSTTGLPFFGRLSEDNNVFYGLGYSGNGVVQSYLGGEILSSLALELDNEWTRSPMAKGPLGAFPPEPIRYLGANIVKQSVLRKEHAEDSEQRAKWFDCQMAKFAAAAGKADK